MASVPGTVTIYVVCCAESDDGGPSHDWLWEPPSLPNSTWIYDADHHIITFLFSSDFDDTMPWSMVPIMINLSTSGTWKNLCLTAYSLRNQVNLQLGGSSLTFLGIFWSSCPTPNLTGGVALKASHFSISSPKIECKVQILIISPLIKLSGALGSVTKFSLDLDSSWTFISTLLQSNLELHLNSQLERTIQFSL